MAGYSARCAAARLRRAGRPAGLGVPLPQQALERIRVAHERGDDRVVVAVEAVVAPEDVSRGADCLAGGRPVERNRLEVHQPFALLEPVRGHRSGESVTTGVGIRACSRRWCVTSSICIVHGVGELRMRALECAQFRRSPVAPGGPDAGRLGASAKRNSIPTSGWLSSGMARLA